ncbi:MAG: multiheme c-type cytochrome, partial [Bryobacterales bacterium]|nr:multiheme c-type cytochrome [Bryobacterales bacterium]
FGKFLLRALGTIWRLAIMNVLRLGMPVFRSDSTAGLGAVRACGPSRAVLRPRADSERLRLTFPSRLFLLGRMSAPVRIALMALAALALPVQSQIVDTALFRDDDTRFTVLDQAESEPERRALRALLEEPDLRTKDSLAEEFLSDFPASPLLAAVHDIAAKTAIDLGEFDRGIAHAEESLRILPENPLLLVAVADARAAKQQFDQAVTNAREALRQLDRFDKPSQLSASAWAALEPQLRSSCHLVLGRAALTQSFQETGSVKARRVANAIERLNRSRSLDRANPQAAYLLGIALGLARQRARSESNLADAYRLGGPLRARARQELEKSYRARPADARTSFEDFVDGIPSAQIQVERAKREDPSRQAASYAGSDSCRDCHSAIFDSWKQTGMARMFREFEPANVLGNFGSRSEFKTEDGVTVGRVGTLGDRPYMEFRDDQGQWKRHLVDYTIGSKWQQAYATRLPDGRIQVFPVQYNLLQGRWLNFWRVIDPPGTERSRLGEFHHMSRATNYQLNCASCHTSQLSTSKARHPTDFVQRESGINCEMCHGPSADHVSAARAGQPLSQASNGTPLRFASLDAEEHVALCGRCHMQSNLFDLGPRGEVNFTGLPDAFFPPYKGRPINEFSQKAFHRDGRFRETTFIGESFVRSACFRIGGAHCGSCHDPHPANPEANPKSLKFLDEPDRMCLQCHREYAEKGPGHTLHAPESSGSRCASCHMPKIMHALMFEASTHRIDDIPDAEATVRFGQDRSPNACLLCHDDRNPNWAQRHLARWPGTDN